MRELAPAKINLCLYVGPLRSDGYHELVSVMQAIDLADELELTDSDATADDVRCPDVEGPNLAASALAAFREHTGWDGPPQLLQIEKRIPVAAGLGGGSADAAATLRLLASFTLDAGWRRASASASRHSPTPNRSASSSCRRAQSCRRLLCMHKPIGSA